MVPSPTVVAKNAPLLKKTWTPKQVRSVKINQLASRYSIIPETCKDVSSLITYPEVDDYLIY